LQVPIFPLGTVLFPGGPLPLRIFEPRYLDMISDCLRNDREFGVLLIRDGRETGPSTTYEVGTLAKITDWYQGSDGLLGVTAVGGQRFRLLANEQQTDGLNLGQVELLQENDPLPLPAEHEPIAQILTGVLDDLGRLYESLPRHLDDANWVSYRFIEILPISVEQKQQCLETADPLLRLQLVSEVLDSVRVSDSK
jgi:Lon protease-like protein